MSFKRYNSRVHRRLRHVAAALAAVALLALLPLGAGALAASNNGTIVYVHGGQLWIVGGGSLGVDGTEPSWSPDGQELAYVDTSGKIATCVFDGTSCGSPLGTGVSGSEPAWSPDGSRLAYVTPGHQIHTMDIDGTGDATITSGAIDAHPTWKPDGTELAFDRGGILYRVSSSPGGTPSALTITPTADSDPAWSPNGNSLAFVSFKNGPGQVYVVAATGGTATQVTPSTSTDDESSPNWSPDGTSIVYADSSHGIRSATQDGGGWQAPVPLTTTAGDASPDWQLASSTSGGTAPENTTPPTASVYRSDPFTPPFVGDLMIGTIGTWTGTFPITFTYQWVRCDADPPNNGNCFGIPGATSTFYVVADNLYGYRLRLRVTATNDEGTTRAYSTPTGIVGVTAPKLEIAPGIFGQNVVGQTLSVSEGIWSGVPRPTITYEWRRCDPDGTPSSCVPIAGATTAIYIPTVDDIGHALRVYLTGTNVRGTETRFTVHTYPIVDKPHFAPSASIPPSISGVPQVGLPLTGGEASFVGDTPIATKLQWQRCDATGSDCKPIRGATRPGYTPKRIDIGSTLRFAESATNAYGHMVATSLVTEPISLPLPHVRGKRIAGGAGSDYLVGTPHDDTILGGRGNDAIFGMGGYDRIYGGGGNDVITVVGPGGARISAGTGSDTIYAQDGYRDTIDCGAGRDRVVADAIDLIKPDCEQVDSGSLAGGGGTGLTP
jgi:hypothetical protein